MFSHTRVLFQALIDYLEGGQTLDEFLRDFPTVTRESRNRRAGGGEGSRSHSARMKILLDECVPRAAKTAFSVEGHGCTTVPEAGLAGRSNGELLQQSELQFEVFITLEKGIAYQQNLAGHKIAILVIRAKSSRLADILPHVPACLALLSSIEPGQVIQVGDEH